MNSPSHVESEVALTGAAVLYEVDARVAYLTLNRAERLNAFNDEQWKGLLDGLARARDDDDVRVVVIRGAGRSFSAGADVAPAPAGDSGQTPAHNDVVAGATRLQSVIDRFLSIYSFPKPTIAQVHGHCLGVATQLATVCDLTLVSEDAKVGVPTAPLGGGFVSPMAAWLIGPKRAKELSFTVGYPIDGTTAAEWGWANRAVPAGDLEDEVRVLAERIARLPSSFLYVKKMAINRQLDVQGFTAGIRACAEFDAMSHHSDDMKVVRESLRSHGLKGTLEAFRGGELW